MDNIKFTGAIYSLFRFTFGAYLVIHFFQLFPWASEIFSNEGILNDYNNSPLMNILPNILSYIDSPLMLHAMHLTGLIASFLLAIGFKDKIAAITITVILAWLFQRNPLIANPSLPLVGWMLIFHLFTKNNPLGSLSASKQYINYDWRLSSHLHVVVWVVLAFAYSYSGYTKLLSPSWVNGEAIQFVLNNPLSRDHFLKDWLLQLPDIFLKVLTWCVLYIELFFAFLALFRKCHPFIWSAMLIIQFGFLIFLNFADLTFPMLLIHFLTFDQNWIKQKNIRKNIVYYDGQCGLCHWVIKFLLSEDQAAVFHFKPLQNSSEVSKIALSSTNNHYKTFVLKDHFGNYHTESTATKHILLKLGGIWYFIGRLLNLLPNNLLTFSYRYIGQRRQRIFSQPDHLCPIVPAQFSCRFIS